MNDLIRRADAIDAIERADWYHQAPDGSMVHGANSTMHQAWYKERDVYKALENVSTAQRWIPCYEKSPTEAGTYLCTCKDERRTMVTVVKWLPRNESWNLTGARSYWKVVAWMPLPEPYEPPKEET